MKLRPILLDRYLLREFALAFIVVISFCALLLLVASIFDRFSDILKYDASIGTVVLYFLSSLPGQLMHVVPIAAMLAVLFSVGTLARSNEVLAMLTSGVHGLRLSVPIVFAGIFIVIGTFIMNEYVVPPLERMRNIYDAQLEDKDLREVTMNTNVFTRGKSGWYYFNRVYSIEEKQMIRPVIYQLDEHHSSALLHIEADRATFIENQPEQHTSLWMFDNPRIWQFDAQGNLTSYDHYETSQTLELEEDLATVLSQQTDPEEMNFNELSDRIRILDARNQPTADLRTDLFRKVTFPIGILIIMLIGFAFAVKSRSGTAMTIIGYGISWAVAYYVVSIFLQALGSAGTISPAVATITPLVIFGIAAVYFMRRSYQWHA